VRDGGGVGHAVGAVVAVDPRARGVDVGEEGRAGGAKRRGGFCGALEDRARGLGAAADSFEDGVERGNERDPGVGVEVAEDGDDCRVGGVSARLI
jgi:hypothetical protein